MARNKHRWIAGTAALAAVVLLAAPTEASATGIIIESNADTSQGTSSSSGDTYTILGDDEITHNEIEIDPDTGEPVTDAETEMKKVTLDSDTTYDPVTSCFIEKFGSADGETVTCTVANGMITNYTVSMTLGDGMAGTVYRNGAQVNNPDFTNFVTPGNYAVRLTGTSGEDLGTYSFRIIATASNITEYRLPDTFSVESVMLDGFSMWTTGNTVSFEQEGQYNVVYKNDVTGIEYSLSVLIDHTAPTLALAAVNEKNTAHTAVDISDLESGATLTIVRDGEIVEAAGQLTTPGTYQLTVTDAAGNVTTYAFTIYMYFTISSVAVIVLLILCQFGLIGYLIVSRQKIKVR